MGRKRERTPFASEAALCAAFAEAVTSNRQGNAPGWTVYPETGGFDILLHRAEDGVQIGIEAKLRLNLEVLCQAYPVDSWDGAVEVGPHYRAILVPSGGSQSLVGTIAARLGVTVISQDHPDDRSWGYSTTFSPYLPGNRFGTPGGAWHEWCPLRPVKLPDYVPDCGAGNPAPVRLTDWKVKALRIAVLLADRPVTRADFKALGMDSRRWTDPYTGWLTATPDGYVPGPNMPDFAGQHPRNFEEIKADRARWDPFLGKLPVGA